MKKIITNIKFNIAASYMVSIFKIHDTDINRIRSQILKLH